MALGTYPDGVPVPARIPPSLFRSEQSIGRFEDISGRVGLERVDQAGGAIFEDFDGDGLLDMFESSQDAAEPLALFVNRGDGRFERRCAEAGVERQLGGLSTSHADYDNDGWPDLMVNRGGWRRRPERRSLLRNNGDGTFEDVTARAKLILPLSSQVGAWADYDNDGWLDLFAAGESGRSRLYRSRRDGTFAEVAAQAGIESTSGSLCKGASWGDFDRDGYPDLLLNGMLMRPRLYHNNRDGTFTDVGEAMGITKPFMGFSCWWFDHDGDGWQDAFLASYEVDVPNVIRSLLREPSAIETLRLYRNVEGQRFEDVTARVGLDTAPIPMG
jgi:hypothetical protein